MSDRKTIPGKFVWFELLSSDAKKAQAFYGEVLGWKVQPVPIGPMSYDTIVVADAMIGGYVPRPPAGGGSRWLAYASVADVDATAKKVTAAGGKIVEAPHDIPGVGRRAVVADPQGAELGLFHNTAGDPPDVPQVPHGAWVWNELHTTDRQAALRFYHDALGYTHMSMDVGRGQYHVFEASGNGRGGMSDHLAPGMAPHWMPYVSVADPDAIVARARALGGEVIMGPDSIPDVGRAAVLRDPTGALFAVLKPMPGPQMHPERR